MSPNLMSPNSILLVIVMMSQHSALRSSTRKTWQHGANFGWSHTRKKVAGLLKGI